MNEKADRHTLTINHLAYVKLRRRGRFGESYSELILRLLHQLESITKEEKQEVD
jgi:predicted CopG family antitoxin